MNRSHDVAARIRAAADEYIGMRADLEAGEPWPLATDFGPGPEASWGPPEVLAHVAEMLPYWLDQVERILASEERATPFGRTALDPVRLAAIEADRQLPVGDLLERIDSSASLYAERLARLADADLDRVGVHPRLGEISVGEILERFAAAHAEDHVGQLRDGVGGRD